MKTRRREKLENELGAAEGEFRVKLIAALQACARGQWGLFGQSDHVLPEHLRVRIRESSGFKDLAALGEEIAQMRSKLEMAEPFALYARLLEIQGRRTQNDLGEPKLAQSWLDELGG